MRIRTANNRRRMRAWRKRLAAGGLTYIRGRGYVPIGGVSVWYDECSNITPEMFERLNELTKGLRKETWQ